MEAFGNIESQTVERFFKDYLKSNGNPKFRFVVLGVWTVDLLKRHIMLTDDKTNTKMHRMVVRGTTHRRPRPKNSKRLGSVIKPLQKRKIDTSKPTHKPKSIFDKIKGVFKKEKY